MTSVLVVGDVPVVSAIRPLGRVRRTGSLGRDHDPSVLVGALDEELGRYGTVLVLYPTWGPAELPRLVERARRSVGTDSVAAVGTSVSPLALAVLAAQAAAIGAATSAGVAVAALPTLAARLQAGAWVSSVARLDGVAVTLVQHALSWWPTTRFAVTLPPTRSVRVARRRWPRTAAPWPLPGADLVVVGSRDPDRQLVEEHVLPAFGITSASRSHDVVQTSLPPDAGRWWGARRVLELVACPSDMDRTVEDLLVSYPCEPCRWCGQPVLGPRCDFCDHIAASPTRREHAGARPAVPAGWS